MRATIAFSLAFCSLGLSASALDGPVEEIWAARYHAGPGSTNEAVALAVDVAGHAYVAGASAAAAGPGSDFVTVKYSFGGEVLWMARYNGPADGDDIPRALRVDAQGNVFVTGSSAGVGTGLDIVTVKYDASGTALWTNRFNGPGNETDFGNDLAVDASGHVVVVGSVYVSTTSWWPRGTTLDTHFITLKYTPAGALLWSQRWGDKSHYEAQAVALDSAGSVFVAGPATLYADPRAPGASWVILKYTSQGVLQTNFGPGLVFGNGTGAAADLALAVTPGGDLCVSGSMQAMPPGGLFLHSAQGNRLWGSTSLNRYRALTLDTAGNCYVAGSFDGFGSVMGDFITVKHHPTGTALWSARYDGEGRGEDVALGLAADPRGNCYVTGRSQGTNGQPEWATLKYTNAANPAWVVRLGSTNGPSEARAVALGPEGRIYVTGFVPEESGVGRELLTVCYAERTLTISPKASQIVVEGLSKPGQTNRIERSEDLVHWQEEAAAIADRDGHFACTNGPAPGAPQTFFRLRKPE